MTIIKLLRFSPTPEWKASTLMEKAAISSRLRSGLLVYLLFFFVGNLFSATMQEVIEYQPIDGNLLQNGSFELGLGASPFYPVWLNRTKHPPATMAVDAIPLPEIDRTVAHTGKASLHFKVNKKAPYSIKMYFKQPILNPGQEYILSFWVRSNGDTLSVTGSPQHRGVGSEWKRCRIRLTSKKLMCIEIFNSKGEPYDVWIDDIMLYKKSSPLDKNDGYAPASPVEISIIPEKRDGLHFLNEQVPIHFAYSAPAVKRKVNFLLVVRDLSRYASTVLVKNLKIPSPTPEPLSQSYKLPKLKQGQYQLLIVALNNTDKKVLGVGRLRFAVLNDLRGKESLQGFNIGSHGGLRLFSGKIPYAWRGSWSADEYFRLMTLCGITLQRDRLVFPRKLEPKKGVYNWSISDNEILGGVKYGHKTILMFPSWPKAVDPDHKAFKAAINGPDENGNWWYKTGTLQREGVWGHTSWNKKMKLLIPDFDEVGKMCEKVTRRYHDALFMVEMLNEYNGICTAKIMKTVAEHVYPALKKGDPGLPVVLSITKGVNAAEVFFKIDGASCSDGYTYHPYGRTTLSSDAKQCMEEYADLIKRYSTPEKKLIMGDTERHFMELGGMLQSFQAVQRALLDWGYGAVCSANDASLFFVTRETQALQRFQFRASFSPGPAAVAINGLSSTLAGCKLLKRIDKDDRTLILAFERNSQKYDFPYVISLTAADQPGLMAHIHVPLGDCKYKTKDMYGADINELTGNDIYLDRDTIYLLSKSPNLISAFDKAVVDWKTGLSVPIVVPPKSGCSQDEYVLKNGLPSIKRGCTPAEWILTKKDSPVKSNFKIKSTVTGNLYGAVTPGESYILSNIAYSIDKNPKKFFIYFDNHSCTGLVFKLNGKVAKLTPLKSKPNWFVSELPTNLGKNSLVMQFKALKPDFFLRFHEGFIPDNVDDGNLMAFPGMRGVVNLECDNLDKLFDCKDTTKSTFRRSGKDARKPAEIIIKTNNGMGYSINKYRISYAGPPAKVLTDWTLWGSIDGKNWDKLDKQTPDWKKIYKSWRIPMVFTFTIPKTKTYPYYKFIFQTGRELSGIDLLSVE